MAEEQFINKVEAAGIMAFDLLDFKPNAEIMSFDIKDLLFMGLIVKEKEFKTAISEVDFSVFSGKTTAVHCSADAIIPPWVYIIIADKLYDNGVYFDFMDVQSLELEQWKSNIRNAPVSFFENQKVVIRARPDLHPSLYMLATKRLKPIVKSLFYGEVGMPKVIFK
jgi:hypothetical protein